MSMKCGAKLRGAFMGYCGRPATVQRDGVGWCWQHDPQRFLDERKARADKRKAEAAAREARVEAEVARTALERAAGIRGLSDDELRRLVVLGGVKAILARES